MSRSAAILGAAVAAAAISGACVAVALLTSATAAGSGHAAPALTPSVAREPISFGNTTCAPSWPAPEPGANRFVVTNHSAKTATVYLFRSDSGTITATITGLKPGASRAISVRLKAGKPYSWGCDLNGYPRHVSEAQPVPRQRSVGDGGVYVVPVSAGELLAPQRAYRHYVARRITVLGRDVSHLRATIAGGELAGARTDWLTAHLAWLSIGQDDGAYGAFGNLGSAIDGISDGLVGGLNSQRFTGFHRVEHDLWGSGGLTAAGPDVVKLTGLISRLARTPLTQALPTSVLGLSNWTLRGHEVLEDALRDTLSGDDDYGSHTALASIGADIAATRTILALQAPLITPRAPYLLLSARRQLRTLAAAMKTADPSGRAISIRALPRLARARIDAATGAVLETLAPVPDLLRIGTT